MQQHTIDGLIVMPPLELEYRLDPTVTLKHEEVTFEQGWSFKYHTALQSTRDLSFNKFSNFYLTDTYNVNDIIELQQLPGEFPEIISTFLGYNRLKIDPLSSLSADSTCLTSASAASGLSGSDIEDEITEYVTILPDNGSTGTSETKQLSAENFIGLKTRDTLEQKFYFNIMLLDGVECVIYHLDGDKRYYLKYDVNNLDMEDIETLEFEYGPLEQSLENNASEVRELWDDHRHVFKYTYFRDQNLIRLFKRADSGELYTLELLSDEQREGEFKNFPPIRIRTVLDATEDLDPESEIDYPNMLELTDRTTLRIRPQSSPVDLEFLNSKLYNYKTDTDQNNLLTDTNNSHSNIQNNHLLNSEYYFLTGTSLPVNIMPLKNQVSSNDTAGEATGWESVHSHQHREYNKINTGTNQLLGSDKIYLEYTNFNSELCFKPGMNYFNTPPKMDPYVRLNINDTKLSKSGSIAGDRPSRSDKIYKKHAEYSNTTRWGDPSGSNVGTWLCTWLSGAADPNTPPVWMDRYYNPSTLGEMEALSYDNDKQHSIYNDLDIQKISTNNHGVYDRKSTMTIEPGCFFAYYHLNRRDFNNTMVSLQQSHVQSGFDDYKSIAGLSIPMTDDTSAYDGAKYTTTNKKVETDSGELSISFDVNFDNYEKIIGHQLLGNYTNKGIGIFNTNDVSPFVFATGSDGSPVNNIRQGSSLRFYDTSFNLYNYVTNDSFLDDDTTPALFEHVVIRELPDNIFTVMSNGEIIEMNHDGIVLSKYDSWVQRYIDQTASIADISYDQKLIYMLTHTGESAADYEVVVFNMISKQLYAYPTPDCIVVVDKPSFLTDNNSYGYGRSINTGPPTLIHVKDDPAPYQNHRALYVAWGDKIVSAPKTLWIYTRGEMNDLSGTQTKHDVIYQYNTKRLSLEPGVITDNNVSDSTLPLSIIDYKADTTGNIWVSHTGNVITKLSKSRQALNVSVLEEQQILSMALCSELSGANIQQTLNVFSRSSDSGEIQFEIGPVNHPTANPGDPAFRKASAWYDGVPLELNTRPESLPLSSETFVDTTDIIYPFVEGSTRFGAHNKHVDQITSTDTTGIVINGDYTAITEDFDILVEEAKDVMYSNKFDLKTNKLVSSAKMSDFQLAGVERVPQLYTQYDYGKENYNQYSDHNMNLKILLEPQFDKTEPDLVNIKVDLATLNTAPYTGFHNITVNVNNRTGRVELWIDGQLDENTHVHTFPPEKYRFNNTMDSNIVAGVTPYLNNTLLGKKINMTDSYTCRDMQIKNFNIFTTCLNHFDIVNIMRNNHAQFTSQVMWNVPSGLRNYIDGVQNVFNHSLPPRKSNTFNINVRNSKVESTALQNYITNKIKNYLPEIVPAGTRLRDMSWVNEILDS